MNKITTLAAISMFAVIMGMTAFAPALATKPVDVQICHYEAEGVDGDGNLIPESVAAIIVNENAVKAHLGLDGHEIHSNSQGEDWEITGEDGFTIDDCPVIVEEE